LTPSRTGGDHGNFEVDRVYKNVGRIHKSLGTSDKRVYNNRLALLDKLAKNDRFDLLRAFKHDKLTIYQLIEADDREKLGSTLASLVLSENLWTTVERVLAAALPKNRESADYRKKANTVRRYAVAFRALQVKAKAYLRDDATVGDLALVPWSDLWDEWKAGPTDWTHMKEAVSRFLTLALKDKWHPFARDMRQLIPSKTPTKRKPNLPFTKFLKILEKVPSHAAPSYRVLAFTGMRVGEYLRCNRADLDPENFILNVPGTKNDQSAAPLEIDPRLWPMIEEGIPSKLRYKWLREYWNRGRKKAGAEGVTMHDLRHSAGQWAHDRGIAESKIQPFFRHANAGQTRDYLLREATLEVSTALADLYYETLKPAPKRRRRA